MREFATFLFISVRYLVTTKDYSCLLVNDDLWDIGFVKKNIFPFFCSSANTSPSCPFIDLFDCQSIHASVRLSLTKLINTMFWKQMNNVDVSWHKWSMVRGHETIHFGGQEVKG